MPTLDSETDLTLDFDEEEELEARAYYKFLEDESYCDCPDCQEADDDCWEDDYDEYIEGICDGCGFYGCECD